MRRPFQIALPLAAALVLLTTALLTRGRPTPDGAPEEHATEAATIDAPASTDAAPTAPHEASGRLELDSGASAGPPARDTRIVVRIVGSLDGGPIAHVPVQVIQRRAPGLDDAERIRHRATAGEDGVCDFVVEPGIGWTAWVDDAVEHGYASIAIEALAPGESREVELELPARGNLVWFGRVEIGGAPVAGARAELLEYGADSDAPASVASVMSDALGLVRFDATSFAAQDVRVRVDGVGITLAEVLSGHETSERAQVLPLWPLGALHARVVDAAGAPLSGIEVAVSVPAYMIAPPDVQDNYAPRIEVRAETDDRGIASLEEMPAEIACDVELRRASEVLLRETDAVVLPAGGSVERRFVIGGEGTIDGQLLALDGRPIAGARIELFADRYEYARPQLHVRSRGERAIATETDDSGRFRYEGVPYGHWYVGALPPETARDAYVLARPVHLSVDSATATITLRVDTGHHIAGVVVGDDGEGLEGVDVTCWSEEHGGGPRTVTGADGSFRLSPLTDAVFNVHAREPSAFVNVRPVEVAAGTEDLVIQLTTGAKIRGVVRDAWTGEVVGEAQLHAYAYDGERPHFPFAIAYAQDGTFELDGLPEGAIAVRASTQRGHLGFVSGVRARRDAHEEVEILVETGVPIRIRYTGRETGVNALVTQNDATVTYISIRPGETTTCQVLPGRAMVRIELPDGTLIERTVDVARGSREEIALGE